MVKLLSALNIALVGGRLPMYMNGEFPEVTEYAPSELVKPLVLKTASFAPFNDSLPATFLSLGPRSMPKRFSKSRIKQQVQKLLAMIPKKAIAKANYSAPRDPATVVQQTAKSVEEKSSVNNKGPQPGNAAGTSAGAPSAQTAAPLQRSGHHIKKPTVTGYGTQFNGDAGFDGHAGASHTITDPTAHNYSLQHNGNASSGGYSSFLTAQGKGQFESKVGRPEK